MGKERDITKSISKKIREYKKKSYILISSHLMEKKENGDINKRSYSLLDQKKNDNLILNNLKDEIRQVCGKYQVKVQDATRKRDGIIEKTRKRRKSLFWKMILSKELDQRWFNSTKKVRNNSTSKHFKN